MLISKFFVLLYFVQFFVLLGIVIVVDSEPARTRKEQAIFAFAASTVCAGAVLLLTLCEFAVTVGAEYLLSLI